MVKLQERQIEGARNAAGPITHDEGAAKLLIAVEQAVVRLLLLAYFLSHPLHSPRTLLHHQRPRTVDDRL
jgi:hypothetical protein